MNKVYKYKVERTYEKSTVTLPSKCKVLDIEFQGDDLFVWALVNTEDESSKYTREIEIYGTGWEIKNAWQLEHLKTVHHNGFVWHVFIRH